MSDALPPDRCETMADVRRGVDRLDRQLVDMLAERFAFMRAAARIKPDRSAVRDEARKTQVVENVRAAAAEQNLPADDLAEIWAMLVETSIAYEMAEWERLRR